MEQNIIKGIRSIPTLPMVLTHLLSTLEDPNSSASDLENIIRNDPALTTKLLAVANSAYYGFREEIITVSRAVVAVGYTEVRNLCLGLGLMNVLNPSGFQDERTAVQLWLHSVATADVAGLIAARVRLPAPDVAFTAGLVHDLGIVVMAGFHPEVMEKIITLCQAENVGWVEAEAQVGVDHEKVGTALAEHWRLPGVLVACMGGHHRPRRQSPYSQYVAAVHLADHLTRDFGFEEWFTHGDLQVEQTAMDILKLDYQDVKLMVETVGQRRGTIESLWSQMLGRDEKAA